MCRHCKYHFYLWRIPFHQILCRESKMAPDDQVFPRLPDGTNTEMEDCMSGEYQKRDVQA